MEQREYHIEHPGDLNDLVNEWIKRWEGPQIVLLYGPLGSGKTTLVGAFAKALGVEDEVTSPTFSLVREYVAGRETVYHVDLYRLEDPEELRTEIGLDELLDRDSWIFIEWPEIAGPLLQGRPVKRIELDHCGENARKIIVLENELEGGNR